VSRIVSAVNKMIQNSSRIRDIVAIDKEYFFVYDSSYQWSITFSNGDYLLFYYPEKLTFNTTLIGGLVNPRGQLEGLYSAFSPTLKYVLYSANEIGSQEAFQTFQDLYKLLEEKAVGLDAVLDKIIGKP